MDYIVITDLEATCDSGPNRRVGRLTHEILEFPFLVWCVQSKAVVLSEQHYVTPDNLDDITPFCTNLTGITRSTVDEQGQPLEAVVARLETVCAALPNARSVTLLCDGRWDVHFMLQKEIRRKGIRVRNAQLWSRYYDLKVEFGRAFPLDVYPDAAYHPSPSLRHMARYVGSQMVGSHHCGMDDCESILGVLLKLFERGHVLQHPVEIGADYDPLQDKLIRDFNESFEADTLTLDALMEALEFDVAHVVAAVELPSMPSRNGRATLTTYVVVLDDAYCAQVFFARGNVCALVYSRSHFVAMCRRNSAPCLVCCWRPWLRENAALRSECRALMTFPQLVAYTVEQAEFLAREVKRFIRTRVEDQCVLKTRMIQFEMRAAALLLSQADDALISEQQLAARPQPLETDEKIYATNWAGMDGNAWDAHFGTKMRRALRALQDKLATRSAAAMQRRISNRLGDDLCALARAMGLLYGRSSKGLLHVGRAACEPADMVFPLTLFRAVVLDGATHKMLCVVDALDTTATMMGPLASVVEALDGVSCALYYDGDSWAVATCASADGAEAVAGPRRFPSQGVNAWDTACARGNESVAAAFWRVWRAQGHGMPPDAMRATHCFHFVLCLTAASQTASLVKHRHDALHYTGAYALPSLAPEDAPVDGYKWQRVRRFALSDANEARDSRELLHSSPTRFRGFVLHDGAGQRMTLLSPSTVALEPAVRCAHIASTFHDALVNDSLLQLALWVEHDDDDNDDNDDGEWLSVAYPLLAARWAVVLGWVRPRIAQLQIEYARHSRNGTKKAFLQSVMGSELRSWLVGMREARTTDARDYLRRCVSKRDLAVAFRAATAPPGQQSQPGRLRRPQ